MAIKISGNTIIDDSRVIVNADKIGIGQTTPRYDLEIHSNQYGTNIPIGIAVSATSTQSNDTNKAISVFNNTDDTTFSVSYRGRVDALEYHGVFKGSIDPGVTLDKAEKIKIQTDSSNISQYLTFVDSTSGYEDVKVHTGIRYNPNFYGNGGSSRLSIDGDVGIAGTLTYEDVTNVDSIGLVTARTGVRITTGGLIVNAGISSFGSHIYPLADDTYNIGESDDNRFNAVYAKEFRGGTFYGTIDGGVSLVADTVKTVKRSTNASHYLTFVDSNNDAATAESMYTDGDITYNPNTNELVVPKIKPAGIINASGNSGTQDYVIKADGSGGWDWAQITTGSVGIGFTDLDDTPNQYDSGDALKLVRVNNSSNGLEFVTASNAGKTYTLDAVDSNPNAKLRLSDGSTNDDVLITAGTGISIDTVSASGFTINATGSGSLSNLDVKQFSNHTTTPKTERTCPNPIEVNVSGIGATIGIGSTSNAYGRRYIQDTAPSTGVCEGDIWFDTSTPSSGSSRVAILRDEKDAGAYGGKPGAGEYAGYRGAYVPGPTGGGGTFDPDTWFPRNINTKYDPNSFVSVGIGSTSTFGLEAGSYKINWRVPAFHVDRFQSRLAYNTNSDFSGTTSYYYGTSQYSGGDPNYPSGGNFANSSDESEGEFVTTISATTYFKIEQWIYTEIYTPSGQTDFSDSALGVAINRDSQTNAKLNPLAPGHEVYTQVKIEDLATAVKDGAFGDKIQEGNTKAEVIDSNGNGHFLVETEGTERLRIGSSGQLGIAGANYGTSGQVLTSQGSGSAPTWANVSGAGSAIILLAEKTATGTSVEFTGIPSDAMEITVMLKGVSANGGNDFVVQLGTSGGYITSGYVSNSENTMGTSNVASNTTNNAGFVIFADSASSELHGSMIINKASSTSYTEIGEFRRSNSGGSHARGSLSSVSGTVDRLKILLNGTNTFDGGILSVSYKTSGGGSTSGHTKVAVVKDQKNTGVAGGLFVKDGWRDRDLTVKDDPFNFVTLYTNASYQTTPGTGGRASYFSLPAGKYKIKFRAPALSVNEHMAAIGWSPNESDINKTYANGDFNSGGEIYGSSEVSNNNTTTSIDVEVSNSSEGSGIVEISQTNYFKVVHYSKDTSKTASGANLNTGFGNPASIGSPDPETYTIVEIEDLTTATKSGVTIGDKIEEGDTSAEVIDTGSDGHFIVKAEGKEKFRVNGSTNNIFIGGHTSDNPFTYLRFAASQYGAADIRPMDELNHKIGLSFYTDNTQDSTINPAERMHLTHNGILNIGRAVGGSSADPVNATGNVTAGIKLLGATSSATPGDGFAMVANALTTVGIFNRTNSTGAIIEVKNNGNTVGSIYTPNGTGTTYGSNSDYRLKENVVNLTDGITRLKTLKPYRFNFKTDTSTTVDGFLAHEVTAVPEAIIGTKDQVDSDNNPVYQQIDQSKLVPLLVAALQEAVAKIEILETEVAALKG